MELWPHQTEALEALRQTVAQGVKRIVLQAPTGSGKTRLAAAIVEGAQKKGNKLAFVVSSISLIDQTIEAFGEQGITGMGVIQADHIMTDWAQPVQICSVQTLHAREKFPDAQIVVFDECHVLHEFHKKWLTDPAWQSVPFIGLSATPWSKGLGKYFETLLIAETTQGLIEKGLLSKFRVFATGHPNLSKVKIVAGDYHEGQLSAAMQEGTLTADIIETWKKRWGKGKTFVFGVDCAHAQALQARFQAEGVSCAYQDARTSILDRAAIKRQFHNGEVDVICNVATLTVGVDYDVRCIVLARPTRSEMLFVQIIGRGLRTAEGKNECIILDHSDTTARLGFVTDIHHDHLHDGKPVERAERKPSLPKPCPVCSCLAPKVNLTCPNCGYVYRIISSYVEEDGELAEITAGERFKHGKKRHYTMAEKERFYAMLLGYVAEKSYKIGWAAMKYKDKFAVFPNHMNHVSAMTPDMAMRSWIKHKNIQWAKSKRRLADETEKTLGTHPR
jgi:superfamily II DNA or RNA helicase